MATMNALRTEPAMVIIAGGTTVVQAFLQLLIAFNVPITTAQHAAITSLVGVILGLLTRANVTPIASLPPGIAGKIADAKAAKAASDP